MQKIFIIAGEASGDDIGTEIIKAFKKKYPGVLIEGIGGPKMAEEGLVSLIPFHDLNIMGLTEVIPHIMTIKKHISSTATYILKTKPDLVLTIDSPGFTKRVAKHLRKMHYLGQVIHCVAPTVWAWRPGRAKKMAELFDGLLCLFKFEPAYFETYGLKSYFIGHPLADKIKALPSSIATDNTIALFPGSRRQEIQKLLPIFLKGLRNENHAKNVHIVTLPHLVKNIEAIVTKEQLPVKIITDLAEKETLLQHTKLVLAASGTVTLEMALRGIPTIVAYKVSWITYHLVKLLIKIPFVSLANILLGKEIFLERLQHDCTPKILKYDVMELLSNDQKYNFIQHELKKIKPLVACPEPGLTVCEYAVQLIMEKLDHDNF
jgi:lipid-A-disaccharide synthase